MRRKRPAFASRTERRFAAAAKEFRSYRTPDASVSSFTLIETLTVRGVCSGTIRLAELPSCDRVRRSALNLELLPLVNAGHVRLLENRELLRELRGHERHEDAEHDQRRLDTGTPLVARGPR